MTEYLKPKFTVPLGGQAYRDGWEAIFGQPADEEPAPVTLVAEGGNGSVTVTLEPEKPTDELG